MHHPIRLPQKGAIMCVHLTFVKLDVASVEERSRRDDSHLQSLQMFLTMKYGLKVWLSVFGQRENFWCFLVQV